MINALLGSHILPSKSGAVTKSLLCLKGIDEEVGYMQDNGNRIYLKVRFCNRKDNNFHTFSSLIQKRPPKHFLRIIYLSISSTSALQKLCILRSCFPQVPLRGVNL